MSKAVFIMWNIPRQNEKGIQCECESILWDFIAILD